jgi:hypothetical protein
MRVLSNYRWQIAAFLMLLSMVLGLNAVRAQDDPGVITTLEYWQRLSETGTVLAGVLDEQQGSAEAAQRIDSLWQDADVVRLADSALMQIDTRWLRITETATPQQISAIHRQIDGLLRVQFLPVRAVPPGVLTEDTLETILRDFQYPPQEIGRQDFDRPGGSIFSAFSSGSALISLFLIVFGAAAAVIAARSLLRTLRVQPVSLRDVLSVEDPRTSESAQELAQQSEHSGDYRSAVRYLYLACLLLLDERGLIRYEAALTNREHLLQVADQPRLRDLLASVVNTFDQVWYGFEQIDAVGYTRFRAEVERLSQMAESVRRAA